MAYKKITMVNSGQIVARGWKGMKTHRGVETFTIKQHVNHVYWRHGNRKILLVDVNDFQQCWKKWKQQYKSTTFSPTATKPSNKINKTRSSSSSRSRSFGRKSISRKRTTIRSRSSRRTYARKRK